RPVWPARDDWSLDAFLAYVNAIKEKYLGPLSAAEIRVTVDPAQHATLKFSGFPGGSFSTVTETNKVGALRAPQGHTIKTLIGGRDDAFFNDLPGFFRSINYPPPVYHVPHTLTDCPEPEIPKTLPELQGNHL